MIGYSKIAKVLAGRYGPVLH